MKNTYLPILIILALLLSACNGTSEAEAPEVPAEGSEGAAAETEGQPDAGQAAPAGELVLPSEENPCVPFNILDQTLVTPYPNLPAVTDADWAVGPEDAAVTFMEYSEPQCPFCAQLEPLMVAIYNLYPNDVRLIYRHRPFPESFHDKSFLASQALEAAGKQSLFHELKNYLFEHQSKNPEDPQESAMADSEFWAGVAPNDFDEWLAARVPALGIDADQFLLDMFNESIVDKVKQAQADADALDIRATPTLFINGFQWPEQQRGIEIFSIYVELLKNKLNEFKSCPTMGIDVSKSYTATIETTKGTIVAELYPDQAMYSVNSFVYLARDGWYDGLPIIVANEFILSGDPSNTGYGGPGYAYINELSDGMSLSEPGMLAVFGFSPDLSGSSFFINKMPLENEQGRTVFGRVLEGMDVVNAFEPSSNSLESPVDSVLSITITEK